jgi:multiple sugar transport system substrate-binding protein
MVQDDNPQGTGPGSSESADTTVDADAGSEDVAEFVPDWVDDIERRDFMRGGAAALPALTAGCSSIGGDGNGGGDGNEVHLLTDYSSDDWETMWNETVIPRFNEDHPDTSVNLEFAGVHGSGEQRLATLQQSGSPPETFTTALVQVGDILANDGFASVQEEWDQIEENHESGIIAANSASAGGDALLIPNGAYTNDWVYRRDLFEQVGVEDLIPPDENIAEDPLLWDDVLTAAEAISNDKDIQATGVAVSGHMQSGASQKNWTAGLNGAGGGQFQWKSDAREEAEVWIDADHHVPSLEFWNQAAEFSPDPSSLDYGTEFELWASDRLAQVPIVNAWVVESTWAAENEAAAFGTDVTLNPVQDESTDPVDFGGISLDGHTVFADSDNASAMKDMAVQMYETPERAAQKNLLEPLRFITPYPDALETDTYQNADIMSVGDGHFLYLQEKITNEIVPHLNSSERPSGATPAVIYAFTQQQGREAMNRLLVQDMTPQRVHELTKEKAEEALAEGKERTS